jgi:hypothetical protein
VAAPDEEESGLEHASREVARAIWQTVLLARDESKARGLIGQATRRRLVATIFELARLLRRRPKQ